MRPLGRQLRRGFAQHFPRERSLSSADDRRAARPGGTARHRRAGGVRSTPCWFEPGSGSSASCSSTRTKTGVVHDLRPFIERAHEAGVLVAVGADLLALTLAHAPRRDGRRRGVRQLAALRRAAGVRWPARGVLRDARGIRAAGAGTHHRRVGRCARRRPRTAWRSRRASSTSGARRRRRTSARRRRCSPTWRRCTPSITVRQA